MWFELLLLVRGDKHLRMFGRSLGFDCDIDQYHANQRWPAWMEHAIASSKFVLVVCTPTYLRRWNNQEQPGIGLGAQWESLLTRQHLYSSPERNDKFIPVIFDQADVATIPTPLADVTRIDLSEADGLKQLQCRLLNIPPAQRPPIRTSLAPVELADGFFASQRATKTSSHLAFGLRPEPETLYSNLFPVRFPSVMQTARVNLKRNIKCAEHFRTIWTKTGQAGEPPVDYWIEDRILHTFRSLSEPFWEAMIHAKAISPLLPMPTSKWAISSLFADKNKFIKLLNRCLDQHCLSHEMLHKIAWSKQMKCHLFVAAPGQKVGRIKVKAITKHGEREVYKAKCASRQWQ